MPTSNKLAVLSLTVTLGSLCVFLFLLLLPFSFTRESPLLCRGALAIVPSPALSLTAPQSPTLKLSSRGHVESDEQGSQFRLRLGRFSQLDLPAFFQLSGAIAERAAAERGA